MAIPSPMGGIGNEQSPPSKEENLLQVGDVHPVQPNCHGNGPHFGGDNNIKFPDLLLDDLTLGYGQSKTVHNVRLALHGPGVFGLFGAPGSGKSTLLAGLAGLLHPKGGSIALFGAGTKPTDTVTRRRIGYLPHTPHLPKWLTTIEFLQIETALHGMNPSWSRTQAEKILDCADLVQQGDKPIGKLDLYSKRRLGIAQAMVNVPDLLLLDDPVADLDDQRRAECLRWTSQLGSQRIVIMASHRFSDLEPVCEFICFLHGGGLLCCEPTAQFGQRLKGPIEKEESEKDDENPHNGDVFALVDLADFNDLEGR